MPDDDVILRARAEALARAPERPPDPATLLEIVSFAIAGERYAVDAATVREVCPLGRLTPIPCTPRFIAGVVNVRGRIVPVLDLRKLFDLPEPEPADTHHVVLVAAEGVEIGLLADAAVTAGWIPIDSLQSSLETLTEHRRNYLKGVTPARLIVLDATRILADPRIVVQEEVEI